jgi:hypothetical protein
MVQCRTCIHIANMSSLGTAACLSVVVKEVMQLCALTTN